jgi:hypothetical protein
VCFLRAVTSVSTFLGCFAELLPSLRFPQVSDVKIKVGDKIPANEVGSAQTVKIHMGKAHAVQLLLGFNGARGLPTVCSDHPAQSVFLFEDNADAPRSIPFGEIVKGKKAVIFGLPGNVSDMLLPVELRNKQRIWTT